MRAGHTSSTNGKKITNCQVCTQNPNGSENFLNKRAYYDSSNFGFRGVLRTIFFPSNCKKQTNKNNKEQQPQESRDTQVVT